MAKTVIDGYTVEVEPGDNGVECWISKGHYSASLACAENEGELADNSSGATISINEATVDRIRQFAERNGY